MSDERVDGGGGRIPDDWPDPQPGQSSDPQLIEVSPPDFTVGGDDDGA